MNEQLSFSFMREHDDTNYEKKIILHLCADIGSDTKPYQDHPDYDVRLIGSDIGVQNYTHPANEKVYGIFANPPCTEFSNAHTDRKRDLEAGLFLVKHCLRIIEECNPVWHAIENPANGLLRRFLGKPAHTSQPYQYGSPWTKRTALWGNFNVPPATHTWDTVEKNDQLYVRPNHSSRKTKNPKPSLAFLHWNAIHDIPEFECFVGKVTTDNHFRSLCSQRFAKAFFDVNK